MTPQDQELLQRQLRALQPAPRHDGVMIIAAVALFAAGIALGDVLAGHRGEPPTRTASIEAPSLLYSGSALPERRRTAPR